MTTTRKAFGNFTRAINDFTKISEIRKLRKGLRNRSAAQHSRDKHQQEFERLKELEAQLPNTSAGKIKTHTNTAIVLPMKEAAAKG